MAAAEDDDYAIDVEIEESALSGFVGAYHVLNRIGSGAVGDVYAARSVHPTRRDVVAIKVLKGDAASKPSEEKRARDEAYLLSQLEHTNVLRTIESGVHEGRLYIVMDYIDGVDLDGLLRFAKERGVSLSALAVSAIFQQLLAAMAYVHAAKDSMGAPLGLVHRDLCPSNVFVGKDGRICVGDFGISLSTGSGKRSDGLIAGHLGYMAPEQLRGKELDLRCDLFSLGAILYRLVCGRAPFHEGDAQKSIRETNDGAFAPPPEPYAHLLPFFERALAVKPGKRFESASEMRDAFLKLMPPAHRTPPVLSALAQAAVEDAPALDDLPRPSGKSGVDDVALLSMQGFNAVNEALLEVAGYRAIVTPGTETLTRNTGVPVVIDLDEVDDAQLAVLADNTPPMLVVLGGELTAQSFARAEKFSEAHVMFLPYRPQDLAAGIGRLLLRKLAAPTRVVEARTVASRRVLMLGMPQLLAEEITRRFAERGVAIEAQPTLADAMSRCLKRSFHLVVRAADALDQKNLADVAEFRRLVAYDNVPFLLWTDDLRGARALLQRFQKLPDGVACITKSASEQELCAKIHETLSTAAKRAFERFNVDIAASYTHRGVRQDGKLIDVSRLGAMLLSDCLLHKGENLALRCENLELTATIAHVAPEKGSNLTRIGLDLACMTPEQEASWLRFIARVAQAPVVDGTHSLTFAVQSAQ